MPKLLIITFSILLIYINIGYYLQVCVLQKEARKEMDERILKKVPDSCLTKFELSTIEKQITWQEEGKEFLLDDELYDVVKTAVINGKTYLFCLNDVKEEKIIYSYGENVRKKATSNQGEKDNTSFFAPMFLYAEIARITHPEENYKKEFSLYNAAILNRDKKVYSPPPKA